MSSPSTISQSSPKQSQSHCRASAYDAASRSVCQALVEHAARAGEHRKVVFGCSTDELLEIGDIATAVLHANDIRMLGKLYHELLVDRESTSERWHA